MTPQNPEEIKNIFTQIFAKFDSGQQLSLEEEEMLGLYRLRELKDVHKLDEQKFSNYKFRHLYLIYYQDLSFEGEYFKPNFDVSLSKISGFKEILKINEKKFNQEAFNQMQSLQRAFNAEIVIKKSEVEKDKKYLDKVANEWANEMLNERHSNQNLALLSKETRDTIRKIKIEKFINGSLTESENIDVKKAILKSKYIHNEALKMIAEIGKAEVKYKLDDVEVFFNYGTIIHILNRHFAQLSSNENISKSKTFHSPSISPNKLNSLLLYIFQKINVKKAMKGLVKADVPIFLKYKNEHYALYFKKDNFNKTKLNINTFYQIDSNSAYGANDMEKIKKLKFIPLSSNLGIYI